MQPTWTCVPTVGNDKERADIAPKLKRLLDAGIDIHAQVVLCPEINDGEILRRTIADSQRVSAHQQRGYRSAWPHALQH